MFNDSNVAPTLRILSEPWDRKRPQIQQHASCGDMEKAQQAQLAPVPMIVQYCVLDFSSLSPQQSPSILSLSFFGSVGCRGKRAKRASNSCIGESVFD